MSGPNFDGGCMRSMDIQVSIDTALSSFSILCYIAYCQFFGVKKLFFYFCSAFWMYDSRGDPLFPMFYHRTVWGQNGPEVIFDQ